MARHIELTADVSVHAVVGEGSQVWHVAQVRENAVLGENCIVGRGAYIGLGVRVGANSKIQNYALVYEPAELAEGVFIGPAAVLTNDLYPRAVNPDGTRKDGHDWEPVGVTVLEGASIGARAVCVAPVTVGRWAMVAAGSTVIKDVPDFALVAGTPAKRIGWIGRAGVRLEPIDESQAEWVCPRTGTKYKAVEDDRLEEMP